MSGPVLIFAIMLRWLCPLINSEIHHWLFFYIFIFLLASRSGFCHKIGNNFVRDRKFCIWIKSCWDNKIWRIRYYFILRYYELDFVIRIIFILFVCVIKNYCWEINCNKMLFDFFFIDGIVTIYTQVEWMNDIRISNLKFYHGIGAIHFLEVINKTIRWHWAASVPASHLLLLLSIIKEISKHSSQIASPQLITSISAPSGSTILVLILTWAYFSSNVLFEAINS